MAQSPMEAEKGSLRPASILPPKRVQGISKGREPWRLESCALPLGLGPRRLQEPGAFMSTIPDSMSASA